MKNLLKLGLTLAASVSLINCASYQQPENPTGASLDRPASGERSARETRYLEQEVVESQGNPAPLPINPMPPVDGTPPVDPAAIQAPMPPTTADTPPTPPPPTTTTTPPETPPSNPTPPTPVAPTASELPYGVPVPGKKGFVYSPYDKSAGFVDVRDISPGTKVRCPYTGKIFRVP